MRKSNRERTEELGRRESCYAETGVRKQLEARLEENGRMRSMYGKKERLTSIKNLQAVKDFFAALGGRDQQGLLALVAEDIE